MPTVMKLAHTKRLRRHLACILGLVVIPAGCVSQAKYDTLRQSYEESQQQLTQKTAEIQILTQERDNLAKEYHDLKVRHADVIKVNQQLYTGVQALNSELNKKKSVIQIQQNVIRLLDDTKRTIESSLKDQIDAEKAKTDEDVADQVKSLKLILVDRILFSSGSTEIKPEGKQLLLSIANSLKEDSRHQIIVAGHTDNVPPSPQLREIHPTNWDLSAARASKVVRFLQSVGKIDPTRLSVRGYGPYRPVATNTTPQGQQKNRRIEIILAPADH